ncbi:MAG: transposase [Actinobacteria bacterium]|nr:transposase [Actinomycetota bacterium]
MVWVAEGKDHTVLEAFYDELGEERTGKLQAISLDMGGAYAKATDNKAAHVQRCIDPFHVVKLCNDAIDKTRRWAWNEHRWSGDPDATWVKRTRWALIKDPKNLKRSQRDALYELRRSRSVLYRAYLIKEELRDIYKGSPRRARRRLERWLAWACRSRIPAFVTLSKTICQCTRRASSRRSSWVYRTASWKGSLSAPGKGLSST